MILADTFGNAFLAAAITAIVLAIIGFWYISKFAPRGCVLAIGTAIYVVGVFLTIAGGDSRLMVGLSGLFKLIGFIGFVLGLIDIVRKRVNKSAGQKAHLSALHSGLVKPVGAKGRPTNPNKGSN